MRHLLLLLALVGASSAHADSPEPNPLAPHPLAPSAPADPASAPPPVSTPTDPASAPPPASTPTDPASATPDAATRANLGPARPPHDRTLRPELSLSVEATLFAGDSPSATTDGDAVLTPTMRLGLGLTEHLVVTLGYRSVSELSRAEPTHHLTTSGDAFVATARYEFPLTRVFALAAELDVEALRLAYDLSVANLSGSTSSWGLGAIPRLVLLARADLGGSQLDLRISVGFALRGDHTPSLRLNAGGARVEPIQLGSLNLSGLTTGATLAWSF